MDDATLSALALQALSDGTLARHDDALRQIVFETIVAPNMSRLRGGNDRRWNEAGWYTLIATEQETQPSPDPFPVPDDCRTWMSSERHAQRDEPFRFFARHAWLELPVPDSLAVLSFVVAYVVMDEALDTLKVRVNGAPVVHVARPCPQACAQVGIELTSDMLDAARHDGHLRLDLDTHVAAVPALIHPGSADWRHLSMAICYPRFEGSAPPA